MDDHPPLKVIYYPHPTLRWKSKPLRRVDASVKAMAEQMLDLMYTHRGVGLAANQVNLPFQLFVMDLTGERDSGEHMVFINPVLQQPRGTAQKEEGCLSLPGIYGHVTRPASIRLTAYDLDGRRFDQVVDDMFARVVQHEVDHLNGVLFFDRMNEADVRPIEDELRSLQREYEHRLAAGEVEPPETLDDARLSLEQRYCVTG